MSLPREPRQKMINMMYLVLTAMLALNVSAEILNAFKTVNRSLENTNTTVNKSTETIMKSLDDKKSDPATAVKANYWYPKAAQAVTYSKGVYDYIQGLKNTILEEAGGDRNNSTKSFKEDNLDIATRLMVEKGEGKKLYTKLDQYKKDLISIDTSIAKEFATSLPIDLSTPPTQNKGNKSWEAAYFRMVPTVAALTMLSKFQNDVKTSENRVVAYCHEQVGKVQVRFDSYAAIIGQSSNYLMPGQKLEIKAGVGAFSKAALPVISLGGKVVSLDSNGVAKAEFDGGIIGPHTIPVHIEYVDQDGNKKVIDQKVEYNVGQANASIALDKMNVLYVGVANPVSVAASGGGDDKISVSISGAGGRLEKTGPGKYNAWVASITDDCVITVSVDGKPAGASKFRTRTIPKPIAIVGSYESGASPSAAAFRAQAGVGAGIKDFPFELQYKVTRFIVSADNDEGYIDEAPCQGNLWSAEAQRILGKLKNGRTVTIDDIYATGPDGRSQKLPSLVYYIK
jgi:gliding motility-associated protein GldM